MSESWAITYIYSSGSPYLMLAGGISHIHHFHYIYTTFAKNGVTYTPLPSHIHHFRHICTTFAKNGGD